MAQVDMGHRWAVASVATVNELSVNNASPTIGDTMQVSWNRRNGRKLPHASGDHLARRLRATALPEPDLKMNVELTSVRLSSNGNARVELRRKRALG
jgi:hypothetical protein